MVKVTYIEAGGTEHHVDVPVGLTVMDGAKRFTIPGIDGDCGGACAACSHCVSRRHKNRACVSLIA